MDFKLEVLTAVVVIFCGLMMAAGAFGLLSYVHYIPVHAHMKSFAVLACAFTYITGQFKPEIREWVKKLILE